MTERLYIEAPTDSQLAYIRSLANEWGWIEPDAVASKQEASAIIDAMKRATYNADDYLYPREVPF